MQWLKSFLPAALNEWHSEEDKRHSFALAMRLLYACIAYKGSYTAFLRQYATSLRHIEPLDVIRFIVESSNLGSQDMGLLVFQFDEVRLFPVNIGTTTSASIILRAQTFPVIAALWIALWYKDQSVWPNLGAG